MLFASRAMAEELRTEDVLNFAADLHILAECTEAYVSRHGIDGTKIAELIAKSGNGRALIQRVLHFLKPSDPLYNDIGNEKFPLSQRVQLSLAALSLLGTRDDLQRERRYAATGLAASFAASTTGGECVPSKRFLEILYKAEK
jgi:hypothetical protein